MASGAIVFELSGDGKSLRETTRRAEKDLGGLGGAAQKMQRNWLAASAAVGTAVAAMATVRGAISAASDLTESVGKVNIVFGESAVGIREWADTAAASMGLSEQAALEAAGTYGNLFSAMGLTSTAAAGLSKDVVQLAVDQAAFNNLGTEDVLLKLRAGLVGEAEPLRQLGININAASTKAKALELGLLGVGDELTDQIKIQARYAQIVEQSSNAVGNFAETSGDLAGQQKILSAKLDDLQADLGTKLIAPMTAATEATIELITWLETLGDKSPFRIGFEVVNAGGAVNAIGGAIGNRVDETIIGLGIGQADELATLNREREARGLPPVNPDGSINQNIRTSQGGGDTTSIMPFIEQVLRLNEIVDPSAVSMLVDEVTAYNASAAGQADAMAASTLGFRLSQNALHAEADAAREAAKAAKELGTTVGDDLADALRDTALAAEEAAEAEARLARSRQGQAVKNMIQMQNAAIASGLALSAADIARLNDPGSFDFGTAENPVNPAAFGSGGPGGVVINATLQMSNGQEADLVVAGQELAATAGR